MRNIRIIPRLDVKKEWLIKGVQMEGWRKVCDPINAAKNYAENGADELIFLDVVASLYQRNNLINIVRDVASLVFIPLTVGGGIRSINDARILLANGADKITLNTAAIDNPNLIADIADQFGSQAVVVSIEAVNRSSGSWEAMTDNGRNKTNKDVLLWAKEAEKRGAGELLVTSIDNDGMGIGFNIELIKKITDSVNIPVIASGGLSKPSHLKDLINLTDASGAAVAQALHFNQTTIKDLQNTLAQNDCCGRII